MRFFLAMAFLALLAPATLQAEEDWFKVHEVYDGDTIQISYGPRVRLIGIDAPELHKNDKLYRDAEFHHQDPKKILKMGKKSFDVFKKMVGKGPVRMEYEEDRKDKYRRTLAYVFVRMKEDRFAKIMKVSFPKGEKPVEREYMVNREMIRYGWAETFRAFDFRYKEEFLNLERQAKEDKRGLWKN